MRLPVIISALVVIVCGALSAFAWSNRPVVERKSAVTGMDVLRDFKCRRSETKVILVRGAEDNHSPAGNEPNFIRAERQFPDNLSFFVGGSYDQVQADKRMTDSFKVPVNVSRGMFLIRMKPVANNDSDTIAIGDIRTMAATSASRGRFSLLVVALEKLPGWTRQGELHFARLEDIRLNMDAVYGAGASQRTLLDFIRSGANDGWVDYLVQDDTSVDFAGLVLCQEPKRGNGVTLAPFDGAPVPVKNVVALTCGFGGRDQRLCDPYVGDMSCSASLPVACFRADGVPMPRPLINHGTRVMWSGGRLAFTEPVPGSRFARADEVDAFCASHFGAKWRTARWHDGLNNHGIAGMSDQAAPASRVWIDVVGNPYATCWTR